MLQVLSIGKALSIQAHPDKELATILHELQPNIYKDGNHKPEMVLALTDFEALYGFIGLKVIYLSNPDVDILCFPLHAGYREQPC